MWKDLLVIVIIINGYFMARVLIKYIAELVESDK